MADLAPGAVLAGYRIEALLGRGGMGDVYRATQLALGRQVALKVIRAPLASDQAFRGRFDLEARAAASIDHPNVVAVFDAGESDGVLFISMRLVDGEALGGVVRREGRLDPDRAARLTAQVAAGLEAAHARGVVHRDIKPGNVLVAGARGSEQAYLVDFGIARVAGGAALTATGRAVGTLGYTAPEVLRGEPADGRADIYGLGCMLFEALTGEVPYPREAEAAALAAHLFEPVPTVRDRAPAVSPELDALVQWMMAKRPDERPQGAGEVADALRRLRGARSSSRVPVAVVREAVRTNLPARGRALVGRERELHDLLATCRASESRVVTVTGAAGVGKTALAMAAAHELIGDFPDGVFWIELESLAAEDLAGAIARALQLSDEPGAAPLERVIEYVRHRRTLIVLGNFEQVLGAANDLGRIAGRSPLTRFLVTSQAPLRVRDELVMTLGSLELPSASTGALPELLAQSPAVALLVERTRRVVPEFGLTPDNADVIAELCRRLDGLPLALELAAARLGLLEPAALLARLDQSLDALGRGGRDLPARHRGLRAALDWATSQLEPTGRALLARLAVFAGGFTVDLAEAVADGDVLDALEALRDVSLIRRGTDGRLSMPPPVRTYALELLRAEAVEDAARSRHAETMLDLAARQNWIRDLVGGLRTVRAEASNLREALRWTRRASPSVHAQLVASAAQLLILAGHEQDVAAELDVALERTRDRASRARLLLQQAFLLEGRGDPAPFRMAAAEARHAGERHALVEALVGLSNLHAGNGDGEQALSVARDACASAERLGDPAYVDTAAQMLGQALRVSGRTDEALEIFKSVEGRAPAGSVPAVYGLGLLADAALDAGEPATALTSYGRALRACRDLGSPPNVAFQIDGMAMALVALVRYEDALTAAAVSDRLRHEHATSAAPEWRAMRAEALRPAREAIGREARRECVTRAEEMGLDRAIRWVEALAQGGRTAV